MMHKLHTRGVYYHQMPPVAASELAQQLQSTYAKGMWAWLQMGH